jgi:hypothetical protein
LLFVDALSLASLRRQMPEILENAEERLTARMRHLLDFLWQEWKHLPLQTEALNEDLEKIASNDEACCRLHVHESLEEAHPWKGEPTSGLTKGNQSRPSFVGVCWNP